MPGTLSMTYPADFAGPNGYLWVGAKFDWPHAGTARARSICAACKT